MIAVGWHDLKLKNIITNRGTTLRGSDMIRQRHQRTILNGEEFTERIEKRIKRPAIIENFYECFSAVDIHDHLRQGSLRMEEAWKTKKWWHRIFSTVLGIIFTDCYLAYRMNFIGNSSSVCDTFSVFLGKLAYQMIFNEGLETVINTRQSSAAIEIENEHVIKRLIDHEKYVNMKNTDMRARTRCNVDGCGMKTGCYCTCCSSEVKEVECVDHITRIIGFFGVCSTSTGRNCYAKHLAKHND